jgi:uncharacterized repeat protein (TIGR03833 family)
MPNLKLQFMPITQRSLIKIGMDVAVVLKEDQRTGELTEGTVKAILTNSSFHPHGIKVKLEDGQVGRVQEIRDSEF